MILILNHSQGTRHSAVNNFVSDIRISHIGKELFVRFKIELTLEVCTQEFNELYGSCSASFWHNDMVFSPNKIFIMFVFDVFNFNWFTKIQWGWENIVWIYNSVNSSFYKIYSFAKSSMFWLKDESGAKYLKPFISSIIPIYLREKSWVIFLFLQRCSSKCEGYSM